LAPKLVEDAFNRLRFSYELAESCAVKRSTIETAYSPCLASMVESIVIDGIWSRYMRAKSMALTGHPRLPHQNSHT
jgi:hypothetical protein